MKEQDMLRNSLFCSYYYFVLNLWLLCLVPEATNFGQGFYYVTDELNDVPGEFKVWIDDSVFSDEVQCNSSFLYRSLFDNPDEGCEYCRYVEIGRVFQFPWTSYRMVNGTFVSFNSKNESVVVYGDEKTDYLVTANEHDFDVLDSFGGFSLYNLPE